MLALSLYGVYQMYLMVLSTLVDDQGADIIRIFEMYPKVTAISLMVTALAMMAVSAYGSKSSHWSRHER